MKNIALYFLLILSLAGSRLLAQDKEEEPPAAESQEEGFDPANPTAGFPKGIKIELTDTTQVEVLREKPLPYVGIHHKVYDDSVVLRWAPSTRKLFLNSNKAGYLLERIVYRVSDLDADSIPEDYAQAIVTSLPGPDTPIKAYDSAQWAPYFPTNDKYALIAAGAAGGQLEVDESQGFALKGNQDQSIFGLSLLSADLSTLAADGLGLRYVDKDIEKGNYYEYRVSPLDSATVVLMDSLREISINDLLLSGDTANFRKIFQWRLRGSTSVLYTDSTVSKPTEVIGFEVISGDSSLALRWDANEAINHYSGYFLEKSVDGGTTFDSLSSGVFLGEPVSVLIDSTKEELGYKTVYQFVDHLDANYVEYTYRLTGIDAFADLSIPVTAKGMGRDLTGPGNPVIKSGKFLEKEGEIELVYSLPEVPDDLTDLYFEYTYHVDSAYARYESETLNPNDTVYYHAPEPDEYSHYFRMVAEDSASNKSYSFPVFVNIPDTIPPPVPTGLHAEIDSTGEVDIQWNDELLAEKGFLGYRVYYSNHPDHEFTQLTNKPVNSNFYIYHLPLNTLTEKIYYKVQAVDMSYNHSEFTEVIEASKPDKKAPVAPVLQQPVTSEEHIKLSWALSHSKDVERQVITRRNGDQVQQFMMDPFVSNFIDTLAEVGSIYQYEIHAVDDAGLSSPTSFPVRARMVDRKRLPGIENLQVSFNSEEQKIDLTWRYEKLNKNLKFVVFRNKNSEKLKRHALVDGTETRFTESVKVAGTYYYAIKVMDSEGKRSSQSEWVSITVGE